MEEAQYEGRWLANSRIKGLRNQISTNARMEGSNPEDEGSSTVKPLEDELIMKIKVSETCTIN